MKNLKVSNSTRSKIQTKLSATLVLLSIILFSFTSCDGYQNGPLVSLVSRENRVANNWKIGKAMDNGKDVTANYTQYELNLSKAGAAKLTAKYSILGAKFDFTTNGTWAFVSNTQKIVFVYDNIIYNETYVILRLTETEMWLKQDGGTIELHLVPQ